MRWIDRIGGRLPEYSTAWGWSRSPGSAADPAKAAQSAPPPALSVDALVLIKSHLSQHH